MGGPRVKAFLVHVYTASTMIIMLCSIELLLLDRLGLALSVMLLAVAIDSTDGMLARRCRVKEVVPEFDGRRMDDIVDYISYVFLPVVFMLKAGMLLEPALVFGSLPLLASVFGFGRVDAKLDEEGFFLGFPSYWNVVVAYFYLIGTPPWLNTLVIVLLAALVFVPTRYMYITRLPRHKWFNFSWALLCGLALMGALSASGAARQLLLYVSLTYPVYYTIYSLVLDWRARKAMG